MNPQTQQKKNRVVAYIDGFNVYHALAKNLPEKYKWLNYRKFVEHFLGPDDILQDIFFFTALPKWDTERLVRHTSYMRILAEKLGIKIISGNYTSVERRFNGDKMKVISPKNARVSPRQFSYGTFEEKQTDVNLALAIFEGAILDIYDKALIFSGDSDIAPGILKARKHKPEKRFTCVLPYLGSGYVISRSCHKKRSTTLGILENSLLEYEIQVHDRTIHNPY